MKYLGSFIASLLLLAPTFGGESQGPAPSRASLSRLLEVLHFVRAYQEMAAVSERVFKERNQGTDAEFARFMGVVARADLSDMNDCVLNLVERRGRFGQAEVDELVAIFESPLGKKVLAETNRVMRATIEQQIVVKPSFDSFSPQDLQRIREIYQTAVFQKYGAMVSSKEWANGMMQCVLASKDVRAANLKL